jgi:Ca2+-binding RTX toxin-like protein
VTGTVAQVQPLTGYYMKLEINFLDVGDTRPGDGNTRGTRGDGADIMEGGVGNDVADGGAGDDVYVFRMGDGNDTLSGGSGSDVILLMGADGGSPNLSDWNLTLTGGTATWASDHVTLSSGATGTIAFVDGSSVAFDGTERIDFSGGYSIDSGNSIVTIADAGGDTVSGSTKEDTIFGGAGDDTLLGGNDEDLLLGGGGDDTLYGGNQDDVYSVGTATTHCMATRGTMSWSAASAMIWRKAGRATIPLYSPRAGAAIPSSAAAAGPI